jgi:hypothetical protein
MKKRILFLTLFSIFLLVPHEAGATYELLDGKLRIKGRFEQYMVFLTHVNKDELYYRHRGGPAVNQSIFTMEGLYTLVDDGEWLINFQSYLRYYYDSAPDWDTRLHREFSSGRVQYHKYQTNRYDNDDWINEMYLDIYKGPWNIRLGKQVVVWSEVEMVQTIDKINAIDLRFATPGIQPFDELKLSLWMFRGFYNSDLPGNLIFEHIFIPGDYERSRTPFEGTWQARIPAPPGPGGTGIRRQPGQGDAVYWLMDQATPRWSISNYQYAFRLRGNSEFFLFDTPYIVDWTLTYWNGLDTGHAVFTDTELVNEALTKNAVTRVTTGKSADLPYGRDVASWKRYEAVGAAFQAYVPPLGGVLRGEIAYEIGRKWNSVDPDDPATGRRVGDVGTFDDRTIERDYLSYGITIDKPFCVPFYGERMQRWGVRPCWDITFGFFQGYWMNGNVKRVWQWSQGYGYKSNTFFTLMIRGGFRHNEFIPVLRAKYNPRNFGYVSPGITYMPGKHVRMEAGLIYFYAKNPESHREAAVEDRDMVYMRFRYEY